MKAFFISPKGIVIPVLDRHIRTVIAEPKRFGLTLTAIKEEYQRYDEEIGHEGYARDKILGNLLGKGWVRVRICKNNYINCQVFDCDRKTVRNIVGFLKYHRKAIDDKDFPNLGLRVYVDGSRMYVDKNRIDEGVKTIRAFLRSRR